MILFVMFNGDEINSSIRHGQTVSRSIVSPHLLIPFLIIM
jgi:hypothetical protein